MSQEAVESWIADFGLASEPHHEVTDQFEWGLLVKGQAFTTVVAQRRSEFGYLAIQASVQVSPEHRAVLQDLDRESRATFLLDLRLALHTQSIGHSIEMEEAGGESQPDLPVRVTVGTNLITEGTGRADFFRANHAIQNGASIVALTFQKLAHMRRWP